MTKSEVEAARERLRGLKFHARDALPNVTALARAEAAFVEVTGERRLRLREAIAEFRLVLESQDPKRIERMRGALNELVEQLHHSRGG